MISAKLQELSQREKLLLVVLFVVLMLAGISLYQRMGSSRTAQGIINAPVLPAVPASQEQQNQSNSVQTPLTNVKDPFQVPASYQPKPEVKPSATSPSPQSAPQPSQPRPKLSGIVSGKGTKKAILEYAGSSETVGIGEQIGPYKIEAITDTQVVLSGKERLTLTVGR